MKKIINVFLNFFICAGITLSAEDDSVLSTPQEHAHFIRLALGSAQKKIIIVSPFITEWRLTDNKFNGADGLERPIKAAIIRVLMVWPERL